MNKWYLWEHIRIYLSPKYCSYLVTTNHIRVAIREVNIHPRANKTTMGFRLLLWLYICSYHANKHFWIELIHVLIKNKPTKKRYRRLLLKLNRTIHATKQSQSSCSRHMVIHYGVCLQIYRVCGHLHLSETDRHGLEYERLTWTMIGLPQKQRREMNTAHIVYFIDVHLLYESGVQLVIQMSFKYHTM